MAKIAADGLGARVVSALFLAPVAIAAVYFGAPYLHIFVAAAATVMAWEWISVCGGGARGGFGAVGIMLAACLLAMVLAALSQRYDVALGVVVVGFAAMWIVGRSGGSGASQPGWKAAGALYIGVPCLSFLWLGAEPQLGGRVLLWILVVVWATDTGGYVFGKWIGGPKLAPRVSPKKTWAGFVGGTLGAAAAGALATIWLDAAAGLLAGLSAVLGVVSQIGDLFESSFKRHFKVKDSSHLIPGHGGLLDRADGLLAAVVAAALLRLFGQGTISPWS